ncbi:DUF935 domain-containing protein [Kaistia algarum]|uniref:DUF935 domain-containing protein n=1 Tax=Kaistia algarum TaxID=2083279 RepID=UPI000CE912E5|nr:DUF935 domain-containing protein [Kaistia algarum]MCX5512269.1 DUF935 domain-containing protein [Kaistia algarum]PPE80359.1 DUF935 domain-containing protein [Kaistia algarum]
MVSSILGPDGRPIERATLGQEIATPTVMGVRHTLSDGVASGLTPERLAAILKSASMGNMRDYLTLAEEMEERYLHYASQVQTRRLAIEGVEISVDALPSVAPKITDAVRALVEKPGLLDAVGAMTDGIAKGLSVVELIWEYQDGLLQPVEYKWRDPRYFQFDRASMTELRLAVDGQFDGVPLPVGKFLRHLPRTKMGIPIRRGFARAAAWGFLIQSLGLKDWAAFAEVYGMPFRIGKYHPSASEKDKRTLLRAVASIANDAAAIIPAGMEIVFQEVKGSQGEAVFGGLTGYIDKSISKLVVGQTMTSDDGASLGQAKIHNEVRLDIQRADCRQICNTLNRDLIPFFVALNFGPQANYPNVDMPVAEPEDVVALTTAVKSLVPLGLKVSQREMRERIGLSEPGTDDELLAPPSSVVPLPDDITDDGEPDPAAAKRGTVKNGKGKGGGKADPTAELAGHVGGCRCGSCLRTARLAADRPTEAVDDVQDYLDEVMEGWQPLLAPMIEKLLATADSAASFDDLLDTLHGLELDGRPLAEKLAIATSIARGLGDIKD